MNKITCHIAETGSLEILHENETNEDEILRISPEEIFDNIDISRRVVDRETEIIMYARITSEEIAIFINSMLEYAQKKHIQYGLDTV